MQKINCVEDAPSKFTTTFGDLNRGDYFIHAGVLWMKIMFANSTDNCIRIHDRMIATLGSRAEVETVSEVNVSYKR